MFGEAKEETARPSEEVAIACTLPVVPFGLPRIELAAMVGSCASVSALFAMPSVTFVPPIWEPRLPLVTAIPVPTAMEEVATFAKVFAPEKYGMLPIVAAVEVERPLKERVEP